MPRSFISETIDYDQTGDFDHRKGLDKIFEVKNNGISQSKTSIVSNGSVLSNQIGHVDRIVFDFVKIFSRKTRKF